MQGVDVAGDIYNPRRRDRRRGAADDGEFYVLEDNLRVPSGVSYMLENRKMMMRLFPELFARNKVRAGRALSSRSPARGTCAGVAPSGIREPTVAVLTPGMYNAGLLRARLPSRSRWAWSWSKARIFSSTDEQVFMRTTPRDPRRVDVHLPAHRRRLSGSARVPSRFRTWAFPACLLGLPRQGAWTLANAIGSGVADDKSVYPYVPEMIKFYLDEKNRSSGNVPTWQCRKKDHLAHVLARLHELVVKETHGAGRLRDADRPGGRRRRRSKLSARGSRPRPDNYIAQPTLALSRPARPSSRAASRRATSTCALSCCRERTSTIVPGGLTRVALRQGLGWW